MSEQKTDYSFKMLYVLAIIMIVDGHIGTYDYLNLQGLFTYSDFHIGLFIFASGYFLNLCRNYKNFFIGKISKLIIPLYLWNLFYGILCWYLNTYQGFRIGEKFNAYNLLIAPITDGHQYIYNMASWFIIPLFFVQVIGFLCLKPVAKQSKDGETYIPKWYLLAFFALALLLGMGALSLSDANGDARNFTLTLLRVLYFLPLFVFGTLYRHILIKYDKLSTPLQLFILAFLSAVMGYIYPQHLIIPSWMIHQGSSYIGYYTFTFIAIMFYLRVAQALTPLIKNSRSLQYISNHTFDIMMHHFIGFMLIKASLQGFENFNYPAYKTDIWYFYFPGSESYWAWLYIVITIVIALLTGFTSRQIYAKIKQFIGTKAFYSGGK